MTIVMPVNDGEKAVMPFIFTFLYLRLGSDSDCMSSWCLLSILDLMNALIPYHVQIQSLSFIGAFTEPSQDSSMTRAKV